MPSRDQPGGYQTACESEISSDEAAEGSAACDQSRLPHTSLNSLPQDILEKIVDFVFGEVEIAGLRGPSVISRDIAELAAVSKSLLPLVSRAWNSLSLQMPGLLSQLDIPNLLKQHSISHLLGEAPYFGPVNRRNYQTPPNKHSPGLHALGSLEVLKLRHYLDSADGPLVPPLPMSPGLEGARAPLAIRLTTAIEKCQYFWPTPSPTWTNLAHANVHQHPLELIDMVRELLVGRTDRGLERDAELVSLLEGNMKFPFGVCGMSSWWGMRKLVCDNWTPEAIKEEACRASASSPHLPRLHDGC